MESKLYGSITNICDRMSKKESKTRNQQIIEEELTKNEIIEEKIMDEDESDVEEEEVWLNDLNNIVFMHNE